MNRSKFLLVALVLVGAVVALEEWRIAGLRGRIGTLEQQLAAAEAAIPPPPRPVQKGESPDAALRRTKARRVMERVRDASAGELATVDQPATREDPAPAPAIEGAAAPADAVPARTPAPAAADARIREAVTSVYGNLIRQFQLEGEEAEYFINLLGEGMSRREQLALDLLDAKNDAERTGVQRRTEEAAVRFAERVREFLGNDDDYAVYQDYVNRLAAAQGGGGEG